MNSKRLGFEAEGAEFGEEGFGGEAEALGGAGFVPAAFAEDGLDLGALDVGDGAGGDVFKGAVPGEGRRP